MQIKRKIKNLLRDIACATLLAPKSFSSLPNDVRIIQCDSTEIKLMINTSNNVYRISCQDRVLFFRECKIHKEIHEYVNDELDYYYNHLKCGNLEDCTFIKSKISSPRNFFKFINMGIVNDYSSGAYMFCMGKGAHYIGLDGMPLDMEERVKNFVQFLWGDLFAYRLNRGVKRGNYQTYNSTRSVATYRLASLLGLGKMIPNTEYAMVYIGGEYAMFGTVMDEAPGFSVERMQEEYRREICSPALQRALNNLNVLDVLALEKDHRPGNYHVVVDSGKARNVVAFDNDSPNSFGIGRMSFETYIGCSPWTINGNINRPYVDAQLAENIFKITKKDLCATFGDLLNGYQLFTLIVRFNIMKDILKRKSKSKWLDQHSWSDKTIEEELSGCYGKTYLSKFIEKRKMPYQPWIKDKSN